MKDIRSVQVYKANVRIFIHYNSRHSLYLLLATTPQQSTEITEKPGYSYTKKEQKKAIPATGRGGL
jgi:hypothetical protein